MKNKNVLNNENKYSDLLYNINPLLNIVYSTNSSNLALQEKFANLLMKNGKKCKAYTILYQALKLFYIKSFSTFFLNSKAINTETFLFTYLIKKMGNARFKKLNNVFKNHFFAAKHLNKKIQISKFKISKNCFKPATSFSLNQKNFLRVNEKCQTENLISKKKNPSNLNLKQSLYKYKNAFANTLLFIAIENVKLTVEVKNVKVSGKTYNVPSIIHEKRQISLAIKSIIEFAKQRKKSSNSNFSECLALELFDALKKTGKVKQKKEYIHQLAESNRAYVRFKWW